MCLSVFLAGSNRWSGRRGLRGRGLPDLGVLLADFLLLWLGYGGARHPVEFEVILVEMLG